MTRRGSVPHRVCQLISLLITLMIGTQAFADATTGKIARLYPNPDGRVYFRLVGDTCKVSKYWYFDFSGDQTKAWYAMLLAAATNGTEVTISHPSCISTQHQAVDYVFQDY